MADLIKKVKIKKQDGTYTDYIPIGAEARYVDCLDGESVEYKFNKKPTVYNTLSEVVMDTKLKKGDIVITLGYYQINDGGSSNYQIVSDETLLSNGMDIIKLKNGLFAKIILTENFLALKQLGCKENKYINLNDIYKIAKKYTKKIFIDGTYHIEDTMLCDEYIEIFGGKLIADSYKTTTETKLPKNIIELNNGGYVHDIEFESIADQIPYINKRAGQESGYASNITAVICKSNNCHIERIKTKFMTGI